MATADRARVTGVKMQRLNTEQAEEVLEASLVVDASGRRSHVPAWLEGPGYPRPEVTSIKSRVGYATSLWHVPDASELPWKALYVLGTPVFRVGAVLRRAPAGPART